MTRNARRHLAMLLIWLPLAGCTYTMGASDPGTLTVRRPGSLPAVTAQRPPAPAEPPPDGVFHGVGLLNGSPGSGCRAQIDIRNFVVSGRTVRYRGFRGTIGPGPYLEMQAGNAFIYGYFDGGRFLGHYWRPGPTCTYDFVLEHAG